MKVLFDTNIWIDIILHRQAYYIPAICSYTGCLDDGIIILIAATSLKDIYHVSSKFCSTNPVHDSLKQILDSTNICAVDGPICEKALTLEEPDFEDGIIAACAIAEGADAIISRDKDAFKELGIPCYTSEEFVRLQGWEKVAF